jgi:hypothetical protein
MLCPLCRQIAPDDAAFCGNCGAPLTVGSAEQAGLAGSVAVAVPAEAVAVQRDRGMQAIIGFVAGILGLAAWLVPFAGMILGLLGLIFGSIAFHSRRRVFARSGIALSAIVLAASLFMWVHSAQRLAGTVQAQDSNGGSANNALQTVTTPCYSTKLPIRMRLSGVQGSCTFQSIDPLSGEQQAVKVLNVPGLSAEELADVAAADVRNVLRSVPKGRLNDERPTLFAGSVAYQATVTTPDDSGGMIEYVYYPTKAGNLVIVTHSMVHVNADLDVGTIEDNWSWL